jgi:hypothetical protein
MNSVQKNNMRRPSYNESQGELQGNLYESQGGLPGLRPLRSDGSQESQAGRGDRANGCQRQLEGGAIRLDSTQITLFS